MHTKKREIGIGKRVNNACYVSFMNGYYVLYVLLLIQKCKSAATEFLIRRLNFTSKTKDIHLLSSMWVVYLPNIYDKTVFIFTS